MSNRRKIFLFTDWYEPGFKAGGPIQSCKNTVNALSDDLDFWIFTSDRDLGDEQPYPNLVTDQWQPLSNGARIWYSSPGKTKASVIRKLISDVKPDAIYLNSMYSPGFSLLPLWVLSSLKYDGRIVLAPRGMLNKSAVSRKKWKKKMFLSLFSLSKMSKKIIFHATDKREEADIRRYFKKPAQIHIIEDIPNVNSTWQARNKQAGQVNCVFISRIHPIKNLLYAINVVKTLAGCTVWFDIYGPVEDESYFQKCREAVSTANPHIHINFKGPLANSRVFDVLENYHVFFLPTQGENFGHVIYEALSSGCILLISDKTPWNSIEQKNAGWALPLTDNRTFAAKLKQVCAMNEFEFNNMSRAAFDYSKKFYASMNFQKRYKSLFGEAAP